MKKRSLMAVLLVGAMLIGCGGSGSTSDAGSSGNAESDVVVETQQSEVSTEVVNSDESLVADVTEIEMQLPEDLPLGTGSESSGVVDEGRIFGLKVTPYGQEVTKAWNIPFDAETQTGGVIADLPVKAEIEKTTTEDGKYATKVTYTIKFSGGMSGDWKVFVFDAVTGDSVLANDSVYDATASETTLLEDGTNVWSATVVSPEESDLVFVWGQVDGDIHDLSTIDTDVAFNIADYADVFSGSAYSDWVFLTTH